MQVCPVVLHQTEPEEGNAKAKGEWAALENAVKQRHVYS